MSNVMKICSIGKELFLVDGRTDMTKLIVALRNFVNAPKYDIEFLKYKFFLEQSIKSTFIKTVIGDFC